MQRLGEALCASQKRARPRYHRPKRASEVAEQAEWPRPPSGPGWHEASRPVFEAGHRLDRARFTRLVPACPPRSPSASTTPRLVFVCRGARMGDLGGAVCRNWRRSGQRLQGFGRAQLGRGPGITGTAHDRTSWRQPPDRPEHSSPRKNRAARCPHRRPRQNARSIHLRGYGSEWIDASLCYS